MSHERDAIAARPIYIGLGALLLLVVLGWAIPTWLEVRLVDERTAKLPPANPLTEVYGRKVPPAPRLQVNPDRDIAALRAAERERLDHYGWLDRATGRAHIPIERAMELLAEGYSVHPSRDPRPAVSTAESELGDTP
ncbi:MAG: hypothetical protein P8R42_21660 [Candidatus Binatia bacterium]|nr:hypothetical protein [Candidatus Binatia bacterium]